MVGPFLFVGNRKVVSLFFGYDFFYGGEETAGVQGVHLTIDNHSEIRGAYLVSMQKFYCKKPLPGKKVPG